ncbi:TetR/AcrR family transcriptional regulator [Paracoccus sp. (in: a-proteobacteria)]|uniref:TetR/AcrR family transcriptional regulator n=1 Tax=Paracoccus sp. TaxID=267 RepID=UPI003A85B46B
MKTDKQDERRRQIEVAAFELLAEKGYRSTSMLQIAKRASASNQTLYAWYGNKQTLFQNLIEGNAREVTELLRDALAGSGDPLEALAAIGPLFLTFTTGDKAIIVNRAAIADAGETGLLGEAIDRGARQQMLGLIMAIMGRLVAAGTFRPATDPAEAAETYVSLALGEIPMRQALGRLPPLTGTECAARAARALKLTCSLYRQEPAGQDQAGQGQLL